MTGFPLPLVVTVVPSPMLKGLLAAMHILAVSSLWLSHLAPLWQGLGSVLLVASLAHALKPGAPLTLRCGKGGTLESRTDAGWRQEALDLPPALLPWLLIIRTRRPGSLLPGYWIILPDSMPAADFRRLRIWLQQARPGSIKELHA